MNYNKKEETIGLGSFFPNPNELGFGPPTLNSKIIVKIMDLAHFELSFILWISQGFWAILTNKSTAEISLNFRPTSLYIPRILDLYSCIQFVYNPFWAFQNFYFIQTLYFCIFRHLFLYFLLWMWYFCYVYHLYCCIQKAYIPFLSFWRLALASLSPANTKGWLDTRICGDMMKRVQFGLREASHVTQINKI